MGMAEDGYKFGSSVSFSMDGNTLVIDVKATILMEELYEDFNMWEQQ